MFAPALDDAQELGMLSQKLHQIIRLTTLYCMTIVVKGPKDHLHRDPFQRFAQDLRDLLADRQQHGREKQRGIDLQLDGMVGPCPHLGHIPEPCGHGKRLLNGMITNDKFCCIRWGTLPRSWWRRPLRLRS